jgi:hypothetical protein
MGDPWRSPRRSVRANTPAPTGSHAPFRLPKQKILFAAFLGWDAVGAKSFGYDLFGLTDEPFG